MRVARLVACTLGLLVGSWLSGPGGRRCIRAPRRISRSAPRKRVWSVIPAWLKLIARSMIRLNLSTDDSDFPGFQPLSESWFVTDDRDQGTPFPFFPNDAFQEFARLSIESRPRLVQKDESWGVNKRAGERDALSLTATQCVDGTLSELAQTESLRE